MCAQVRTAAASDVAAIFALTHELACVCNELQDLSSSAETLANAFARGQFEALVAELGGKTVGMAVCAHVERRAPSWISQAIGPAFNPCIPFLIDLEALEQMQAGCLAGDCAAVCMGGSPTL